MPLAKPVAHLHWYAATETDGSTVDSPQMARFWHGSLAHSSTSMSQSPLNVTLLSLSMTVHSAVYSLMKSYSHTPFAKPATHVH